MDNLVSEIITSRPVSNYAIEQYLMTEDSLLVQVVLLKDYLSGKKVLFIGDDDHLSLLISHECKNSDIFVLEIDERIIENQKRISESFLLKNHKIIKYDVAESLVGGLVGSFDCFVINPPYGSKNMGYGAKVWITRGIQSLKFGGVGVIVLPIVDEKAWTISNMLEVQKFILSNGCLIVSIDKDVNSYGGLPEKDIGMKSSNIIIKYTGDANNLIDNFSNNLYR